MIGFVGSFFISTSSRNEARANCGDGADQLDAEVGQARPQLWGTNFRGVNDMHSCTLQFQIIDAPFKDKQTLFRAAIDYLLCLIKRISSAILIKACRRRIPPCLAMVICRSSYECSHRARCP